MKLYDHDRPYLALTLDTDDCLLLAAACRTHAELVDDGSVDAPQITRTEGALYRALGFAFEGYALVGMAQGLLKLSDAARLTLANARQEYGVSAADGRGA